MAGPRFNWGTFAESGGKFMYDILSEEEKHKKRLKEIQLEIEEEKKKEEFLREKGLIEGRQAGLWDFMKSDASGEAKVRMWETLASELGLPSLQNIERVAGAGTGMPRPTAGVEGIYQPGGYTPPDTSGIAGMFEPPRKEYKYPHTKAEWQESKKYEKELGGEPRPQLGKTPEERAEERQYEKDMDLINNYFATDETGKFTTSYETVKMIESQVKEACWRQFGSFTPRLPAEKRPGIFQKDLPERLGEPIRAPIRRVGDIVEKAGKKWRVVRFDTDGEPLMKEVK